jgi:hypothetical protein
MASSFHPSSVIDLVSHAVSATGGKYIAVSGVGGIISSSFLHPKNGSKNNRKMNLLDI